MKPKATRWDAASDMAESSAAERFYTEGKKTNKAHLFWWTMSAYLAMQMARLRCCVMGHNYVDDDPGNPEVGPQPNVYCTSCLEG